LTQFHHPRANSTTVDLNLGLTGTTRTHTSALAADLATSLAGHRVTPTAKAGKQVIELCELDLGLTLAGLGVLGEDVEDYRGPVNNFDLDRIFKGPALARRELSIGDNGVCTNSRDYLVKFLDLSSTKVCGWVWVWLSLEHTVEDHRASSLAQCREFLHRILGVFLVPL
jgi:hypothetical protein